MCKGFIDLIKGIFSDNPSTNDVPEPPGMERPSPSNWIDNIQMADYLLEGYYRDANFQLRLDRNYLVEELTLSEDPYASPLGVENTGSMDPVVDAEGQCVGIWGYNPVDQKKLVDRLIVGDIAVYEMNGQIIMHRIKEVYGTMGAGRAFQFLGDNNQGIPDPDLVYEHQIKYIVIQATY